MTDAKTPEQKAENKDTQMTAAAAAKLVKRTVQETVGDGDKKKLVTKKVTVAANEVLAFRDYDTHVMVVTTDGQKLSSADA